MGCRRWRSAWVRVVAGDEGLEVAAEEPDLTSQSNVRDPTLANRGIHPSGANGEELCRVDCCEERLCKPLGGRVFGVHDQKGLLTV
jgi:hypothetical protein